MRSGRGLGPVCGAGAGYACGCGAGICGRGAGADKNFYPPRTLVHVVMLVFVTGDTVE